MYNAFRGMCVADCKIKVLSKRFVDVMYAVTKFRKKVFVLLQMSIISSRGMSVKRESASRFPPRNAESCFTIFSAKTKPESLARFTV